jgi:hypothetical protein
MTTEQYYAMCEQMGWEPRDDEIPKDIGSLPFNSQLAVLFLNLLPDRWDTTGGGWLGKDFAPLESFMNIYEAQDRKEVLDLLLVAHSVLNEHYNQQKKARDSASKNKARVR